MAGTGATDLYGLANEYLEVCAAALAGTPGGPIERMFVSAGLPSWDCCPQLSVHVGGAAIADTLPGGPTLMPGHRITVTTTLDLVSLTATVLRCVPTLGDAAVLPSPQEMDDAALVVDSDLWAIWNYLVHGKASDSVFQPRERELFIDGAVALPQQGGCGGWQIPIRVQLDGYRPTITAT